jgi:hypothetical protein
VTLAQVIMLEMGMEMPEITSLALAFAALLIGCDPHWRIEGRVTDGATSLEGAAIRSECSETSSSQLFDLRTTSSAEGRFVVSTTGPIPRASCHLTVEKKGYTSVTVEVPRCSSSWSSCNNDVGNVVLRPLATP